MCLRTKKLSMCIVNALRIKKLTNFRKKICEFIKQVIHKSGPMQMITLSLNAESVKFTIPTIDIMISKLIKL